MAVHSSDQSSTKIDNSQELSPINILSVDFDWIMAPSIEAYNNLVFNDNYKNWDSIVQQMPGIHFPCDLTKYKSLMVCLYNVVSGLKDKDHYKWGLNHDQIVECITKDWNLKNRPYNLYNIDHHHDCGYLDNGAPTVKEALNQTMGRANWVCHLAQNTQLQSYTWVHNETSQRSLSRDMINHLHKFTDCIDLNVIDFVQFDYVFLSASKEWVPPEYHCLFDTMTYLLAQLIKK